MVAHVEAEDLMIGRWAWREPVRSWGLHCTAMPPVTGLETSDVGIPLFLKIGDGECSLLSTSGDAF